MATVLLGNSFPQSLIRVRMLTEPIALDRAIHLLDTAGRVVSYWGHANTIPAASALLGRDVTPRRPDGAPNERPALTLNGDKLPGLYGEHTDTVLLLSPQYTEGYRPTVGEETAPDQIVGWQTLILKFNPTT